MTNRPLPVGFSEVVAQEGGDVHRDRRTHRHFELEIAQDGGAEDDIEIAMEGDLARTDKGVVELPDLQRPHVRSRTDRVVYAGVVGEQPHPSGTVVRGGRPW